MKKGILCSVGKILIGILAIVFAIIIMSSETGYTEKHRSYGGDAYTGIQNAAAQTANNVVHLGNMIQFGFFSVLLVFGLLIIIQGISDIPLAKEKENGNRLLPTSSLVSRAEANTIGESKEDVEQEN